MGYARVSSKDQNLDRQIEQLKAEKVFTYYTDKASGGSRERPGLDEAMRYVRAGDQLVVTSMDRCARSLTDLYAIVDELVSKGVSVKFLKEGQTYSKDSTPIAKLMLGLLGFVQLGKAVKELDQGLSSKRGCGRNLGGFHYEPLIHQGAATQSSPGLQTHSICDQDRP